ncbi:uncharacterized protein LOC122535686 [Frieseomelitta varia]|uniref:uncharacterized protein LOC122535686 n=1 Tax=Frieseomelitta varia TaxID=561572 RepID=UPI001CB6B141|nr:uncharacterized protein LOC122535686 [Frieseomelitta varia]
MSTRSSGKNAKKRTTGFSLLWYDALLCVATGTTAATRLIRVRAKYYLYSVQTPRTRHTQPPLPFHLLVIHGVIGTSDDPAQVNTYIYVPLTEDYETSSDCRQFSPIGNAKFFVDPRCSLTSNIFLSSCSVSFITDSNGY